MIKKSVPIAPVAAPVSATPVATPAPAPAALVTAPVAVPAAASPTKAGGKKAGRDMSASEALASFAPPPELSDHHELSVAQKAAKDKLENPTVDVNGEHIQTVEEAKIEAAAMQ